MPSSPILALPTEIRLQIFIYALSCATGYLYAARPRSGGKRFILVAFEPPYLVYERGIALPLLQTCKQINLEARDLVYEHNTWAIPATSDFLGIYGGLHARPSHFVKDIWLKVDFMEREGLAGTAKSLEILSRWPAGNLRTVTLNVVTGRRNR